MSKKPNCYKCKYRGTIPGDAHTRCCHSSVNVDSNPFAAIDDMMMGKANDAREKLNITGDSNGVRHGWFMWPANFDPVWLLTCDGFAEKGT